MQPDNNTDDIQQVQQYPRFTAVHKMASFAIDTNKTSSTAYHSPSNEMSQPPILLMHVGSDQRQLTEEIHDKIDCIGNNFYVNT